MEQWILENLGAWAYVLVPLITGILTSFGTEATNLTIQFFSKKVHPNWIVLVWSVLFAWIVLNVIPSLYFGVWEYVLAFITNIIVAIPFYIFAGKFTVDAVFSKYKNIVKNKTDYVPE